MTTAAPATADEPKGLFLTLPIRKIDEEKREVWGFATKEELDQQGEIVEYEASKSAFGEFAQQFSKATGGASMGALREMHQPKAVGSLIAYRPDDKAKGIWIGAKLSRSADGENAWTKVKEGVLTGFSIGAPVAEREISFDQKSGKKVNRVVGYKLSEVSLVDNPACPGATIQSVKLAKMADGVGAAATGLLEPILQEAIAPAGAEKGLDANAYVDGMGQVWKRFEPAPKVARWSPQTDEQRKWVSEKIRILVGEGKEQEQAVAIAHSMAEDHFSNPNKEAAMSGATKEVRNIGAQHNEGSSPGTVTPKLPAVENQPGSDIPNPGGSKGAEGIAPEEQGKPVTVPDGQGKASGYGAPTPPMAPAPAAPAPAAAPHPGFPPAAVPPKCAACGQMMPQPAAPPAGAPPMMPAAPGAPKSAAVGVDMDAGMQKAFSDLAASVKLAIEGVTDLSKRVDKLASSPMSGGPMRTELPSGVVPVEKGGAGASGGIPLAAALRKAIDAESDPWVKGELRKRLAIEEIRTAQGGGIAKA